MMPKPKSSEKLVHRITHIVSAVFLALLTVHSVEAGGGVFTIPSLEKIVPQALEKNRGRSLSPHEIQYRVKDYYYQIQYQTEQLGIAEEVKKHFEKAVQKSEEQFEKAEGDISQSNITKLKLGLSGTLHDIIELENELQISKLALGEITGMDFADGSKLEEDTIHVVSFPFNSFNELLEKYGLEQIRAPKVEETSSANSPNPAEGSLKSSGNLKSENLFSLKRAYLKINEARGKLGLAEDSRKITRALLVTEVANYDFGIGDSGDLFEALIIYTRVLRGYYEAVYNHNMAVAGMDREVAKIFSPVGS